MSDCTGHPQHLGCMHEVKRPLMVGHSRDCEGDNFPSKRARCTCGYLDELSRRRRADTEAERHG